MIIPRVMWGARKRLRNPGTLSSSQVVGVALHWPGMSAPIHRKRNVMAALRSWQNYHMDTHGWSDIAYQIAIDQRGRRYRLRGMRNRSAANGNTDLNLRYGAFLLILAPGEVPSNAMINATRKAIKSFRRKFPKGKRIVGHGEIRPGGTTCPGAIVSSDIVNGTFEPERKQ